MTSSVPTESDSDRVRTFRWGEVPSVPGAGRGVEAVEPDPPLGAIAAFSGTFRGTGFNTIFRPQNFALSPTPLPAPASGPNDNILELNLTTETLFFDKSLGKVPNRGMVQGDMFLNGVPYTQKIQDATEKVDIHFEPGVWLSVPATTAPAEGPTLVRMASIPHGTTITAQGTSFEVPGGPQFQKADITPTFLSSGQPFRFPSQEVKDQATFRLPQDLTGFVAAGTITQDILDDPNLVLKNRTDHQNITHTTVITIDTHPGAPLFGGGTDNIAFLEGDPTASAPNADAVRMTATFWVETVQERITVPAYTPDGTVIDGDASGGGPAAAFTISGTATEDTEVDVTYTQLQYTQTVFLTFNGLSWPHVSVATLVPETITVGLP